MASASNYPDFFDEDIIAFIASFTEEWEGGVQDNVGGANFQRFAKPTSQEEVSAARKKGISSNTLNDTKYCMKIWEDWRVSRNSCSKSEEHIQDICSIDLDTLNTWLCHFVLEMRKKNGEEYPPNTVHHICVGIMRHLRSSGQLQVDFFTDTVFADFRTTLDAEMKRLQQKGAGSMKKQAEPLTEKEEEQLWETGQLGDHTPQSLVDTILFMCGIYFALRSGGEHRALRFKPAQIELVERTGECSFLRYTEDISKNNPGGLKGRKHKPKIVVHHQNLTNTSRCFVSLFKTYQSLCPTNCPDHVFYLKPLKKPSKSEWYAAVAIGHNTLSGTVARLCKKAGIPGYKTNHSLRATAATRLYQAGVDEQLIMEKTGHHSLDGVRSYKRSNSCQQENVSDILSLSKQQRLDIVPVQPMQCQVSSKSQQQLNIQPANLQNMFNLEKCSNVNINVTFNKS